MEDADAGDAEAGSVGAVAANALAASDGSVGAADVGALAASNGRVGATDVGALAASEVGIRAGGSAGATGSDELPMPVPATATGARVGATAASCVRAGAESRPATKPPTSNAAPAAAAVQPPNMRGAAGLVPVAALANASPRSPSALYTPATIAAP
ncbi:MAG: hypothetical protein ACTHU0_09005 [Kofleriaceae bacterium]